MTAYFWVGGSGTWDGTTTTNWALSTGGTGSAGRPTSAADTVTFDANSGLTSNQIVSISGSSVCGGCTISGITGRAVRFQFFGNPTWGAGTYSFQGTDDATPVLIFSSIAGFTRTVTINGTHGTHSNVNFMDINLAGTIGTLTGTRIGDMLGNTGITFDASSTQTFNNVFSGGLTYSWSTSANWTSHIPLPQDDVVISGTVVGTNTFNCDTAIMGRDVDCSGLTGSGSVVFNRQFSINNYFLGKLLLNARCNHSGSPANSWVLGGRGSHQLNFGNIAWSFSMFIRAVTGTYTLQASNPTASGGFSVGSGTFDTNGFNFNMRGTTTVQPDDPTLTSIFLGRTGNHSFGGNAINNGFTLSGFNAFASGSGTWSLVGTGTIWTVSSSAQRGFTATATILITDTSATAKTFQGGGATYNVLRTATDVQALTITGSNQYNTLDLHAITTPTTVTIASATKQTISGGNLTIRGFPAALTLVVTSPGTGSTIVVADGTTYNVDTSNISSDFTLVLPNMSTTAIGVGGRSHL